MKLTATITQITSASVENGVEKVVARVVDGEACYRELKFANVDHLVIDQEIEIFIVPAIDRDRVAAEIRGFLNSRMQVESRANDDPKV